jgi:hypothetical protein
MRKAVATLERSPFDDLRRVGQDEDDQWFPKAGCCCDLTRASERCGRFTPPWVRCTLAGLRRSNSLATRFPSALRLEDRLTARIDRWAIRHAAISIASPRRRSSRVAHKAGTWTRALGSGDAPPPSLCETTVAYHNISAAIITKYENVSCSLAREVAYASAFQNNESPDGFSCSQVPNSEASFRCVSGSRLVEYYAT